MVDTTDKSWNDLISEIKDLSPEEPTFLEQTEEFVENTGENLEELAYGFEKSRWLAGNANRYLSAGGDQELLKQQEQERIAEIDSRYNLSEERKQSGFALTGEIGGTLLDPSMLALGNVGVAAKSAQLSQAAARAANFLITGSVAGIDYAASELGVGEEVDPTILAISSLGVGALGAAFTKAKKVSTEVSESTDYLRPIGPVPSNKKDAYIDRLYSDFNAQNPSRLKTLQDTQTNGLKLGAALKTQKLFKSEEKIRANPKKKNRLTDEQFEKITDLNKNASLYLKDSGGMLSRQAEVIGEGISGVAGRLKEEGTLNANMIRRAVYRPMIGAIGGVGVGYSVNWSSDEDMSSDELIYYAMAGAIGGAASKALMKSNKLSDQDIDMATGEIDKILKANSLNLFNNLMAGSSAAKANAFGGKVATVGKTLFSQRGANLRGAASTSVEENKDLVLQELNFSWSKVLTSSNATNKTGLVNLFSSDAKGLREAAYEYSEGFIDKSQLSKRGFSSTEIAVISNLAEEATSRVRVLTEEVTSTGINIRGKVKDYKLPQFHDVAKIVKNEAAARKAYKKAYRIQSKADTDEKIFKADSYIDEWIDDMVSGGNKTQHTSAWIKPPSKSGDQFAVLRPLTDHFEKPRMFKDFDARLEIKDFLVKDIDQVYRQYVDNTVPIMEFARKFGARGEALVEVKKQIKLDFETALARFPDGGKQRKDLLASRDAQINAVDEMVEDYFGFIGAEDRLARSNFAQNTMSIFVTGANVARLGKVTITSLADLVQPMQSSGIAASLKALARHKDFAKETGFAQRDVLGNELRQYALEVKNPGDKVQRATRAINEKFFKGIGLAKLTSYARKYAYNTGIERGFVVANKLAKGRSGTSLRNEANSLGISDEYAKTLSKFKSVEEAFDDVDGNRILNIIGVKASDRDALIPQIGNRRAFSKSKNPSIRGFGQFLTWAQAKATQMNSLITRMEDGNDILFVRTLGAIAIVNGIETFKSWLSDPTGANLDIDQESYLDQYATLENFGKATGRTGNFNHYLIDKVAQLVASGGRAELDDLHPAVDWATDFVKTGVSIAGDIQYGDTEGAIVKGLKVAPLGKEIRGLYEGISGETLEDIPNRQVKLPVKKGYKKGGEVLDVPNAPSEPDQRIDKMTGMPYDQQAGAAFTDQEDRQDPLQRMGFGSGGSVQQDPLQRMGFGVGSFVKMGVKTLKSLDDEVVEELPMKNTDELIEESKQIAKALEDGGDEADLLKAGKGDPDNVITYHGTDKVFEEFNDDFISSGTGAQINGYGHYFGLETKARQFRDNVTARNLLKMVDIEERKVDNFKEVVAKVNNSDDFTEEFKNLVTQFDKANLLGEPTLYDAIEKVNSLIKSTDTPVSREVTALADTLPIGKMYKVEILGNKNQFLDWKTPLEKQSKYVQNSIRKTVSKVAKDKDEIDFLLAKYRTLRGRDIYKDLSKLLGGEKKASKILYSNGIKGNKKETTNGRQQDFIVFSPVLINITKKYSLPTAAITTALLEVGASTQRNEDDKVNKDYKKFYKGGKVLNSLRSKLNNV
jgi:hypothetical protein